MEQKCPACGSTEHKDESGKFALLQVTQGRIKFDLDSANTVVFEARVSVCSNCGFVSLYDTA